MSQTTTADATVIAALTALPALVTMVAGGKLSGLNTTIQSGIASAETAADNEIASVQSRLDTLESSNPLVGPALSAGVQSLAAAGIHVPSEAALFGAFKAGVNGFLDGLKTA